MKLKMRVDDLVVDSFTTSTGNIGPGTVRALEDCEMTRCDCETAGKCSNYCTQPEDYTCVAGGTCGCISAAPQDACQTAPQNTCQATCGQKCQLSYFTYCYCGGGGGGGGGDTSLCGTVTNVHPCGNLW